MIWPGCELSDTHFASRHTLMAEKHKLFGFKEIAALS